MLSDVRVTNVEPRTVAVARGHAAPSDVSQTMLGLLTQTWNFVHKAGVANTGINVAMYFPDGPSGLAIEAGVEVSAVFDEAEGIVCRRTPGGAAATATVVGDYAEIGGAHIAIRKWCEKNGRTLTGASWEVYGHHIDDPAQRRTEVYYELM